MYAYNCKKWYYSSFYIEWSPTRVKKYQLLVISCSPAGARVSAPAGTFKKKLGQGCSFLTIWLHCIFSWILKSYKYCLFIISENFSSEIWFWTSSSVIEGILSFMHNQVFNNQHSMLLVTNCVILLMNNRKYLSGAPAGVNFSPGPGRGKNPCPPRPIPTNYNSDLRLVQTKQVFNSVGTYHNWAIN